MPEGAMSSPEVALAAVAPSVSMPESFASSGGALLKLKPIKKIASTKNAPMLPRQCSVQNCKRNVPPGWVHKTCERCYERGRRSRERQRLKQILEKALESDEPVTCAICTNVVPMPPGHQMPMRPRRQQFVLCASCQTKMMSANAHTHPAPPRANSHSNIAVGANATFVPGTPPAIHIVSSPRDVTPPGLKSSLFNNNNNRKPVPLTGSTQSPIRESVPARPQDRARAMQPQSVPMPMVAGWSLDVTIEKLMNTPHLNSKGEYINPQFLPSSPSSASTNQIHVNPLGNGDPLLESSPFVHRPPVQIVPIMTTPTNGSSLPPPPLPPPIPIAPRNRNKKPLTIRLPKASSRTGSNSPSLAAADGDAPNPVPQAPLVRLCRRPGCTAVLSPKHLWIFCNRCLNQHPNETDGAPPNPKDRRASAPSLTSASTDGAASWGTPPSAPVRRASENDGRDARFMHTSHANANAAAQYAPAPPSPSAPLPFVSVVIDPSMGARLERAPRPENKNDAASVNPTPIAIPTPPPSSPTTADAHGEQRASSVLEKLGEPSMFVAADPPVVVHAPSAFARPQSPQSPEEEDGDDAGSVDGEAGEGNISDLTPLEESGSESEDALDVVRRKIESDKRRSLSAKAEDANVKNPCVCHGTRCQNLIPPRSKWKTCQPCRKRYREYCRRRAAKEPKWTKQDLDDDEGQASDNEVLVSTEGHRKCTIRSCRNIIPPMQEYRWKMCEACRTRTRRGARKRKYGWPERSDEENSNKFEVKFKKLKLLFKGVPIANVESNQQSQRFALPRAITAAQKQGRGKLASFQTFELLLGTFRGRFAGFVTAQTHYLRFKLAQQPLRERNDQSKDKDNDADASADMIAAAAAAAAAVADPVLFVFDGEFSVVADPAGGEVASRIQVVQASIADMLGIDFGASAPAYQVDPDGRIVGRFRCVHNVLVPLPHARPLVHSCRESGDKDVVMAEPDAGEKEEKTLAPVVEVKQSQPSVESKAVSVLPSEVPAKGMGIGPVADVAVKRMKGELEVSVTWDRTHKFFPGLRTTVRFRMVG